MAGLPLKSGADFYNLEAARLRLHNLGADPTEVGAGLIYFNTSTGLNTSQKARLYTGSAWKTIAFSEDLDVASNADFLALKDKVDTLIGDGVDMDGIIESWKEVEAFLSGMSDTQNLMDYLNTELGKKLDLTGGTLTGDIATKSFWSGTDGAGLYIEGKSNVGIRIQYNKSETGNDYDRLLLKNGVISWNNKPLLHSGNVGEYALRYYGTNMPADIVNYVGYGKIETGWKEYGPAITFGISNYYTQIQRRLNTNEYYVRGYDNGTYTDWKTIAFTDSDVASAQALKHSNGTVGAEANQWGGIDTSNTLRFLARDGESQAGYIGRASSTSDDVYLLSNNALRFFVGANATQAMLINSSGNVTIGGSDLAQEYYKLAVGGSTYLLASKGTSEQPSLGNIGTGTHVLIGTDSYGLEMWSRSNGNFGMQVHRFDGTATAYNLNLQPLGGNVLIGTNTDNGSGAKLQVAGAVTMASTLSVEGQTTLSSLTFSSANTISIDGNGNIKLSAKSGTYWNVATPNGINALTCYYNGNVGIGTTEDSGAKLNVHGGLFVNKYLESGNKSGAYVVINKGTDFFGIGGSASGVAKMSFGTTSDTIGTWKKEIMTFLDNGRVGIGTTDPQEKLDIEGGIRVNGHIYPKWGNNVDLGKNAQRWNNIFAVKASFTEDVIIDGDLHVKGNIIADGEVSAGGRAEEGGNAGGGGAAEKITATIDEGLKFKEISHTLGDNVIVQVYEWNANGQTWDMILTDVETTTNLVRVRFGNETDVPHKVVII